MLRTTSTHLLALASLASLAGCLGAADAAPAADADDASALAAQAVVAPRGCKAVTMIARPIVAPQFHDPSLQQTAGKLALQIDRGEIHRGTILATIFGKSPDGSLLANHDGLFARLGFRTRNDHVVATPTADPCVFDASTDLFVVEGSGPLAHLTGTLHGVGQVNFCGAEGRVVIAGHLCPGA
jgi:hypothetical protein